jgi:hypothetical protein
MEEKKVRTDDSCHSLQEIARGMACNDVGGGDLSQGSEMVLTISYNFVWAVPSTMTPSGSETGVLGCLPLANFQALTLMARA